MVSSASIAKEMIGIGVLALGIFVLSTIFPLNFSSILDLVNMIGVVGIAILLFVGGAWIIW